MSFLFPFQQTFIKRSLSIHDHAQNRDQVLEIQMSMLRLLIKVYLIIIKIVISQYDDEMRLEEEAIVQRDGNEEYNYSNVCVSDDRYKNKVIVLLTKIVGLENKLVAYPSLLTLYEVVKVVRKRF